MVDCYSHEEKRANFFNDISRRSRNFGISSANLLARKELLSALSLSLRQTATVAAFPESELWAKMGPPLCTLFGNICNDVLDLLTANMSHSDFPTVIEAMNLCVNSECHILKASEAGDTAMAVLNSARAGTNQRLAAILTQMQAIARESQGTAGRRFSSFHKILSREVVNCFFLRYSTRRVPRAQKQKISPRLPEKEVVSPEK